MKYHTLELSQEQIIFLKKFIINYDNIDIEEYLSQEWYLEDYEKKDMEILYKNNPELIYYISPLLMFRLQKFYNSEFLCAGWCGCVPLSHIYDLVLEYLNQNPDFWNKER